MVSWFRGLSLAAAETAYFLRTRFSPDLWFPSLIHELLERRVTVHLLGLPSWTQWMGRSCFLLNDFRLAPARTPSPGGRAPRGRAEPHTPPDISSYRPVPFRGSDTEQLSHQPEILKGLFEEMPFPQMEREASASPLCPFPNGQKHSHCNFTRKCNWLKTDTISKQHLKISEDPWL